MGKILILSSASEHGGGIQRLTSYMLDLLADTSHDVQHLEFREGQISKINYALNVRSAAPKADMVIVMHLSLVKALLGVQTPVTLFIHGIELFHHPKPLTQFLLKKADHLFVGTRFVENLLASYSDQSDKIQRSLFPSGLNLSFRIKEDNKFNYALIVSRLTEEDRYKGVWSLLETMQDMAYEFRPYLQIVGAGNDLDNLMEEAERQNLSQWVNFLGYVPDDQLAKIYAEASVFVLPSTQEGQGLVFLEAMQAGLPVIGLKNTVIEEFISDGEQGFLVPQGTQGLQMALKHIKELQNNPQLRNEMSKKSRNRYLELKIEQNFNDQLHKIIRACVE